MDWQDLSPKAREWMEELGHFGPTVHAANREVRGWAPDVKSGELCKIYFTAYDLRSLAAACTEVAEWLEKRALAGEGEN